MRIYEIKHADGEKDWLAVNGTNIEALSIYCECSEADLFDINDSEIKEVPRDDWDKLFVENRNEEPDYDDDDDVDIDCEDKQSFAEWVKENPTGGMIASTCF